MAFDQGTDGRAVEGALDEVALPVTRHQSVGDVFGAMDDAQLFGDKAASRSRRRAASTAAGLGLAQRRDHLRLERAARIRVDGSVDRLGAVVPATVLRVHESQSGSDLMRRPESVAKTVTDSLPQPTALDELAMTDAGATSLPITTTGLGGTVAVGRRRATSRPFTTDRRRRALEPPGDRSQARAAVGFDHDRHPILSAQVFVFSFQRNLRTGRECRT